MAPSRGTRDYLEPARRSRAPSGSPAHTGTSASRTRAQAWLEPSSSRASGRGGRTRGAPRRPACLTSESRVERAGRTEVQFERPQARHRRGMFAALRPRGPEAALVSAWAAAIPVAALWIGVTALDGPDLSPRAGARRSGSRICRSAAGSVGAWQRSRRHERHGGRRHDRPGRLGISGADRPCHHGDALAGPAVRRARRDRRRHRAGRAGRIGGDRQRTPSGCVKSR
jgi:hypothetical protein